MRGEGETALGAAAGESWRHIFRIAFLLPVPVAPWATRSAPVPLKGARRFHAGEGLPSPFQAPREGRRELVAFADLPQGIVAAADLNRASGAGQLPHRPCLGTP